MKSKLIASIACISFFGGHAVPCCIVYADYSVRMDRETAAIFWDADAGVEHFVRSTVFSGKAKDAGFIYPCPSQPFRIEVADANLFTALEKLQPRPRSWTKSEVAEAAAPGGVTVLEQKRVGDYDVSVVRATQGIALSKWLKTNGYKTRPPMTPWLDHYAKQNWVFCAFKYRLDGARDETSAVCISFKAKQPHYPYKMPSDTWEMNHHRQLDLWFVGRNAVKGKYVGGLDWQTKSKWTSDKLSSSQLGSLEQSLSGKSKPIVLNGDYVVTRFVNSPRATNYMSDLTFVEVQSTPNFWELWPITLIGLSGLTTVIYAGWLYMRPRVSA